MQTTGNYNLKKPEDNEYFDQQAHANWNMDLIDAALTPTADPALVPTGLSGKLVQWVSWLANRIVAITGKANWYDSPSTTIEALNTAMGTKAAASDLTNHAGLTTGVHGAVSAATASKIIIRDAAGRAKVAAPAAEDDIALKSNVTNVQSNLTAHLADTAYLVTGGTATALTLTTATLTDGYPKTFIASANNNGSATTINAKPLYKPNTTTAPTLIAGKAYTVWYNVAGTCFFIKASAEGNAVAGHVLAGDLFSNDTDTGITGTMPNNGVVIITPSHADQAISNYYASGSKVAAIIQGSQTFLSSGTFTVPAGVYELDIFLVGGGGAGGVHNQSPGYGIGGGGGYVRTAKVPVTPGDVWTVTIGAGGIHGTYSYGNPTTFVKGATTYSVPYGWAGNDSSGWSGSGGSGGGWCGNSAYHGGSDGSQGANSVAPGTNRGQETTTRLWGTPAGTLYAGGGGGSADAAGGAGGGGAGSSTGTAVSGTANTGGGGGAGVTPGDGGSGVCIVQWGH